LLLYLFLF